MKYSQFLFVFISMIFHSITVSFAQLEMKMSTGKNIYSYGDTIHIACSIKNISDTTISIISGSYGSCQAEFYFNDFYSGSQEQCLATTEKLRFDPGTERTYYWTIDPKRYGLPNRNGEQFIIGKFFQVLPDTLKITAPRFYGGQLSVSFPDSLNSEVSLVKDSLNVEVLSSNSFNGSINELWQITGYSIDSLMEIWNDSTKGRFDYAEFNRRTQYDSITANPGSDFTRFYPLHIGDKWNYKMKIVNYYLDSWPTERNFNLLREVVSDTIMNSNKKYYKIRELQTDSLISNYSYERIDPFTGKVYSYQANLGDSNEIVIEDLSLKTGDSFLQYEDGSLYTQVQYVKDSLLTLFENKDFSIMSKYYESNYSEWKEYFLSDGIGKTYQFNSIIDGYDKYKTLVAAKINGTFYGDSTLVGIKGNRDRNQFQANFTLSQNYPNPFNPSTTIEYEIPRVTHPLIPSREGKERSNRLARNLLGRGVLITLKIYDILGREVATLVNKKQNPGNYKATFNGANLPSGIYYYRLKAGNFIKTKKAILLK